MMSTVSAWIALALVLPTPPAPVPLRGSGPWTVEFADVLCAMGRNFDGVGGPVMLIVKAPLLGDNYEITTSAPAKREKSTSRGSVKILGTQGDAAKPIDLLAFTSRSNQRIVRFSIDGELYKLRDAGPILALDMGAEGQRAFAIQGMPKALDKLEECTRGLRASFGVDQTLVDSVVSQPKANLPSIFDTRDYPRAAVQKGEQGIVGVLGFVTPEGRFRDCKVIQSSQFSSLDIATCDVLVGRARYSPAIGPDGRKVRYPVYARINWELPGR